MKLESGHLSNVVFIFIGFLQKVRPAIYSEPQLNLHPLAERHSVVSVLIPTASLTQGGYIQFLKYVVDVPELTDYTFCIWVRSNNLTYSHPLLSYSKHEEKRLIRAWISPLGTHINLEVLEVPIFSIPVHFAENEWYHICQSWSSLNAAWSLYLNGKLEAAGYAPKLTNTIIDSGGDIVVGQEYTDFDKGLDDGIEGDISGFNFVLASTFENAIVNKHAVETYYASNNLFKREIKPDKAIFDDPFFKTNKDFLQEINESPGASEKTHTRRQIWDESLEFFSNQRLMPPLPLGNHHPHIEQQKIKTSYESPTYQQFNQIVPPETLKNLRLALQDYAHKPLGLLLVELSNDCGYLRGAPLSGKGVLVSWTKTQVRVFGGAILNSVPPFCGK